MIAHFMFSFIANNAYAVKEHQHETYQISFSVDHAHHYTVNKKMLENINGIVINQNTNHSCNFLGTNAVVSYIYKDSILGKRIKHLLNGDDYHVFDTHNKHMDKVLPANYNLLSIREQAELIKQHVLSNLYRDEKFIFEPIQARVKTALAFIEQHLDNKITANEIASAQYVSTVRLQHLFKAEIGMPIGQYIIWKRIKKVIDFVYIDKLPLSMACIKCNFPDQAHFNHMFLKIFGVPPKTFLKSSIIIL